MKIYQTALRRACQSAAVGLRVEAPKGLGWSGYKPLMRNRTAHDMPLPNGYTAADNL
jgi:hypothetical protein